MSYSCSDFTDSILDALEIVPDENEANEFNDSPSMQADYALAEIERLQRIEKALRHAILKFSDTGDRDLFIDRVHFVLDENKKEAT